MLLTADFVHILFGTPHYRVDLPLSSKSNLKTWLLAS